MYFKLIPPPIKLPAVFEQLNQSLLPAAKSIQDSVERVNEAMKPITDSMNESCAKIEAINESHRQTMDGLLSYMSSPHFQKDMSDRLFINSSLLNPTRPFRPWED